MYRANFPASEGTGWVWFWFTNTTSTIHHKSQTITTMVFSNSPPPYEPYPATRFLLDLLAEVRAQRNVRNLHLSVQSLYSYLITPLGGQHTTARVETRLRVAEKAFRDARMGGTFGLRVNETAAFRVFQAEILTEFPGIYNTKGACTPSSCR